VAVVVTAFTKRTSSTGPLLKFNGARKSPKLMPGHPPPDEVGGTMKQGNVLLAPSAIEAWYSGFWSALVYLTPGNTVLATVLPFTVTIPGLAPPTAGSAWQPKQLKALNDGPRPVIVGGGVMVELTTAVAEKTVNA